MATIISVGTMNNNESLPSLPNSIPSEIFLNFDIAKGKRSLEKRALMFHSRQPSNLTKKQKLFDNYDMYGSSFKEEISPTTSNCSSSEELPELSPLDYREGLSISTNDSLRHYTTLQNASTKSISVHSLCGEPNEWGMESLCGDSLDTEEDVSLIPECIKIEEDFWTI